MSKEFSQTSSGIIVPKEKSIQCGHCPRAIFPSKEPKGQIFIKDGRPICAPCRVVKLGRFGDRIRADKGKALRDQEASKEAQRAAEARRIETLSAESNSRTLKNLAE